MMSRTGDAFQVIVGVALALAGLGLGFTWAGAAAVLAGLAVGGHGLARAVLRAHETHDL